MRYLVTLALALLVPSLALAAGGGGHGGELHINWWAWDMHSPPVGWFFVDFVLFIALLVKFTRSPMRKAFAERHAAIKKTLEDNAAAYAKAKGQYDEAREKLGAIEREVQTLITKIKEDGALERDRIVAAARDFATHLRKDSETLVTQEAQAARERLKAEVAAHALKLAHEKLLRELTDADRARLLDSAIAELENGEAHAPAHKRRASAGRSAAGDTGEAA